MSACITQLGRWLYRFSLLIGLLLPLSLVGPIWICLHSAYPARAPRTELGLLWAAVGIALTCGICNLLPFSLYRSWARSRRAMSPTGEFDLADPRVVGIIVAGVCLVGTAAILHAVVVRDVFVSQPATASRYAIASIVIVAFEVGVPLFGYLVGWAVGSRVVVIRRWHRRRKWRRSITLRR